MSAASTFPKFCKTLIAPDPTHISASYAARFLDKALYEFWGFCVNGGASLTQPGGFASNGVICPVGFESGSRVLLASGNDGQTTFGTDIFTSRSINFLAVNSGSLIGKYLVTWKSNEESTEDSIYYIKSIENSNNIHVDVHTGGQRRLGNHPCFWDRHGINFRIVDIVASCDLSGWSLMTGSSKMIFQFNAANQVNSGQSPSQVQFSHLTISGLEGSIGLVFSPAGSWNGSTFSDATPAVSSTWYPSTNTTGPVSYTFIGAGDFLIVNSRAYTPGTQGSYTSGTGFHVEIPKRMYTLASDPNPIAWVVWSNATPSQIAATYYNGFNMVGFDGNVHRWTTLVRSPTGTNVNPSYTGNTYNTGQWQQFGIPAFRFALVSFDSYDNQYITSDGILSLSTPGQFSFSRARLRRVRFTTNDLQTGARIGDPFDDASAWVVVSNGILWPWDNSVLPDGPWRFGV